MAPRTVEVLLDDARPGRERVRRFSDPVAILQVRNPRLVDSALQILQNARDAKHHVAGYFSYELGYVLEKKLSVLLPQDRDVPLLWFGIFDTCEEYSGEAATEALEARIRGRCYAGPLTHEWHKDAYRSHFDQVHRLIAAGDIYQANLSFRSRFASVGDPMALYLRLRERSKSAYGAYIDDGERKILSLSPELFFEIASNGEIVTRPMKGTAPRGDDPQDDVARRIGLQNSEKDRAENLMIVDLLRNDLSRISETGTVKTGDLYSVETYPTVHQMVSTVRAQLKPQTSVGDIVRALFPCGSVTGTPKIRAMEIIAGLEQSPRGVYCGAIGHFAPDGSASFNVAIRTLTVGNERGQLGIGGAVIHDSNATSEYAECLLKSQYYSGVRIPLELIETLRCLPDGGFVRENLHLERMAASAEVFGISFDVKAAKEALRESVIGKRGNLRVRLVITEAGSFTCAASPIVDAPAAIWRYRISDIAMPSGDILLRHKTNWREAYEASRLNAKGCDEVLFVNERGMLTEGSRTNIFIACGRKLYTPPLEEGLLAGCLRRELIESGGCEEAELTIERLHHTNEVFLGNSLRGLVKAVPAERATECEEQS